MVLEKPQVPVQRRRSARWSCDKLVQWRIYRGRAVHQGHIVERSLDGMVIDASCVPAAGTCLVPADDQTALRRGFRFAIVRRTLPVSESVTRMFVEILA